MALGCRQSRAGRALRCEEIISMDARVKPAHDEAIRHSAACA
jgi:hypothetical protein